MLSFVRSRALFCAILGAVAMAGALAQTPPAPRTTTADAWPTRPVHLLVGFPAGASPDLVAHDIAEPLSKALGQPVVIDTKVGEGGNLAADAVAKATDGHTFGVLINGNMTIAKMLDPKVPYDPERDLAPVSLLSTAPLLLAAPADAPGATVQDFFVAARNGGTGWTYGSPGTGTVGHLGMELLRSRSNIMPTHTPYPGNPQVVAALIDHKINLALLPPGLVLPQVKAGKLRAIGVTSSQPSPLAPGVPSLAAGGIAGYNLEIWIALAGPASTPRPVVKRLSAAVNEVLNIPEIRSKLLAQGWQAVGTTPEGLARRIETDTATLGGVILMRGIKAQ